MDRARAWGYGAAAISASFAGSMNVVGRHATILGASPVAFTAAAYVVGAVLLLPFLVRFRPATRRDAAIVLAAGIAGGVVAPLAFFSGIAISTAVVASLLVNLEVAFTTLFAYVFLRERATGREAIALALLATGGLVVAVGPQMFADPAAVRASLAGPLLVALATLAWSVDSTLTTPLAARYDLAPLTAAKAFVGAIGLIAISLAVGERVLPRATWPHAAAVGVFGVALGILFLTIGLKRVGAARSILVFSTAGLWGALVARVWLGESLHLAHGAGAALMIAGVAIIARAATR